MNNSTLTYYAAEGYKIVRPEAIYGRGSLMADGAALHEGGFRAVEITDIYGAGSELVAGGAEEIFVPALSNAPLFHLLLFATLVIYFNMLYRSWGFIGHLYRDMFTMRSESNMIYQGGLLPLQHFKHVASTIGFIMLALVALRIADGFIPASSPIYDGYLASFASLGALFVVVVYLAWYYATHKIIEWVTLSDAAPQLSAIGYMHFVRISVVLYPLAAAWLLGVESNNESVIVMVLVVVAVVMLILYLKDTILFFLDKKISILYWILYLCTAFLLPLSFIAHMLPQRLG